VDFGVEKNFSEDFVADFEGSWSDFPVEIPSNVLLVSDIS